MIGALTGLVLETFLISKWIRVKKVILIKKINKKLMVIHSLDLWPR
jgi:hypothetical protein